MCERSARGKERAEPKAVGTLVIVEEEEVVHSGRDDGETGTVGRGDEIGNTVGEDDTTGTFGETLGTEEMVI